MSRPTPLEQRLLAPIERILDERLSEPKKVGPSQRVELLEAVAARTGGWSLQDYRRLADRDYVLATDEAMRLSESLPEAIQDTGIPTSLALSSLARPELSQADQRSAGAYYTDFRLAQYVAEGLTSSKPESLILDPASGTGILLAAAVITTCGADASARTEMIRSGVCAADLNPDALRGVQLTLASLTDDLGAVESLLPRLRRIDSLQEGPGVWSDFTARGFDAVIGNPPWEKLKISRHEFLLSRGVLRHYGHDYQNEGSADLSRKREKLDGYASALAENYVLSGVGELDLYRFFIELTAQLVDSGGEVCLLVPAGLIRSQSTEALRKHLLETASDLRITVLENRARFFAIDTRFKFLRMHAVFGDDHDETLTLAHATGTATAVNELGDAGIPRTHLEEIRPDLSIPEVRSDDEWALFQRMSAHGLPLGDPKSGWELDIVREVDMTRDRASFQRTPNDGDLPLIEGRMVHQFRTGAKRYESGTGRRAVWTPVPVGYSSVTPQFWVGTQALRDSIAKRTETSRIGFCDITGQTNERTLLASMIPSDVVCGNKVPTVTLGTGNDENASYLWLAIANSLPFDWLIRRVVTTTVNYFLLLGLPFPVEPSHSLSARRLASLAKQVHAIDRSGRAADLWQMGELRAEIDVRVASLYGLELDDLKLMMRDFPLLDRGQPRLRGERRATVTRDLVLARAANFFGNAADEFEERLELARDLGALPYLPAQFVDVELPDQQLAKDA